MIEKATYMMPDSGVVRHEIPQELRDREQWVMWDRHSDRSVRRTTVKLLVEPELITSWGYFEGVGFGVDRANGIVPINSTTVTAVANNVYERVFVENSPAHALRASIAPVSGSRSQTTCSAAFSRAVPRTHSA